MFLYKLKGAIYYMSKVYKNQTSLRVRLTLGVDITDAIVKQIKYQKPSGIVGYWNATVEDATEGIIYYDITTNDINEAGQWKFWAYITFSDGRSAPGEYATETIYEVPS